MITRITRSYLFYFVGYKFPFCSDGTKMQDALDNLIRQMPMLDRAILQDAQVL